MLLACRTTRTAAALRALRRSGVRRSGLSLLEVILSIAILAGAMAATSELVRLGIRQAEESRELTQAQLLCESKMEEVLAGILPPEAVSETPCEVNDRWLYSIEITPLEQPELLEVWVVVTESESARLYPLSFSLARWMIDPDFIAEMEELEAMEAAEGTTESTDSGSSESSSSTVEEGGR